MKKLITFLLAAALLFSFSCKKKPIGPVSEKPTFTIYGVMVKDMNTQKDIASFTVWRNDTLYNSATVKVGNKNIPNAGSGEYFAEFSDTTFKVITAYVDSISSSLDTVTITFDFFMPNTFVINRLPSNDSLNAGGHAVTVYWTVSDSASAYFISVAKGDTIPGANLYSAIVGANYANIPPSAFRTVGDQVVEGYYWVYVVSYNRSFVDYPDVPFALPVTLPANNITGAEGTMGAGVIARKATIYVTTTP
jgi:hypothetical protein